MYHPKRATKIWAVFDCSAESKNQSLNRPVPQIKTTAHIPDVWYRSNVLPSQSAWGVSRSAAFLVVETWRPNKAANQIQDGTTLVAGYKFSRLCELCNEEEVRPAAANFIERALGVQWCIEKDHPYTCILSTSVGIIGNSAQVMRPESAGLQHLGTSNSTRTGSSFLHLIHLALMSCWTGSSQSVLSCHSS